MSIPFMTCHNSNTHRLRSMVIHKKILPSMKSFSERKVAWHWLFLLPRKQRDRRGRSGWWADVPQVFWAFLGTQEIEKWTPARISCLTCLSFWGYLGLSTSRDKKSPERTHWVSQVQVPSQFPWISTWPIEMPILCPVNFHSFYHHLQVGYIPSGYVKIAIENGHL